MSGFTAEQRAELRAAVDQSKREALTLAAQINAARPRESRVVRAARKAERAQQAKTLAPQLVAPEPKPAARFCAFCGTPANGGVCVAHSDLMDQLTTAGVGPSLHGSSADARRKDTSR